MKVISSSPSKPAPWWLFVSASLVLSLFLLFIDEGQYSLVGLTDLANLIPMAFYFVAMLLGQMLMYVILINFVSQARATYLAIFLGSLGGAILMGVAFYLWMH